MTTIDRLLKECTLGKGRIVSICEMTPLQILEARALDRMHVTATGFGFALLPWDQPGSKDQCGCAHLNLKWRRYRLNESRVVKLSSKPLERE
jgi:hypothetical protein